METLIIFIIFIIFSALRSLGQQGRQQPGRPAQAPRRPEAPPPVRPVGDVQAPRPVRRQPVHPVFERVATPEPVRPPVREERTDTPFRLVSGAVSDEPPIMPATDAAFVSPLPLQLEADTLLMGVIFSEVLGQPRGRRKHRFFSGPAR